MILNGSLMVLISYGYMVYGFITFFFDGSRMLYLAVYGRYWSCNHGFDCTTVMFDDSVLFIVVRTVILCNDYIMVIQFPQHQHF